MRFIRDDDNEDFNPFAPHPPRAPHLGAGPDTYFAEKFVPHDQTKTGSEHARDFYEGYKLRFEKGEVVDYHALREAIPGVKAKRLIEGPYFYKMGQTDSVLNTARKHLCNTDFFTPFSSLIAESQTAGRGRMGSEWISPPGNIYACMLLPRTRLFQGTMCPIVVAYYIAEAIEKALGEKILIKWPNDLLLKNTKQKVGGIIVESDTDGMILAGVGINIGEPPLGLPNESVFKPKPGALKAPEKATPAILWEVILKNIITLYNKEIKSSLTPHWQSLLISRINDRLYGLRHHVKVFLPRSKPAWKGSPHLTGFLAGIDKNGAMVINADDDEYRVWGGTLHLVEANDVERDLDDDDDESDCD
jgi:BirA family biotin operon repressor/biotin-[acetyl-CoA-carboxylase] ligase